MLVGFGGIKNGGAKQGEEDHHPKVAILLADL